MAGPHEYSYANQQQQPYPNQQYPPPQYNAPPQYGYYQAQPAPYRRTPRQNFAVVTARQLNIAIPVVIIILSIWWSLRSQICPSDVPIGHECSWMLWTALPVSITSLLWAVVMNISARRANHSMSHVPAIVNTIVQLILALGATACFAILIYHMENYPVWNRSLEGSMIALLVILAIINWVLFGWSIYEMRFYRKERQSANSHIPI
ncbi:uncharacterized protein FFUJ_13712 [Fusarium fujikuroi IMI 58289]|uniref:MARVEL domain-containing protein n=1 Tax=Gibberella fujikuroi (strain CBS 195.34 / IMI 58289 / NRRL A-6831) TaxID=1279085 RepID=S0DY85_GIBF5|nr:uncharacterized protein FFUJ_13712 [Fusarium fujikuroi IMI 58289]KLO98273.1 uncharacterized protein LW94_1210 [Fusarium fujikuroi]CCT67496.1 uncharacterized protein FFUJ_13712 [Fusarium fujikuroi IMI 58289]SCO21371.1 uncharacterized protein FFM5_12617 [Fusarium fujikuroi]SCO41692.1 uncharacterized protein FFMR_06486 [Fusarium fujikuroi]